MLSSFALSREEVHKAIERELPKPIVDDRYRRALSSGVVWLDEFFDERPRKQWDFLKSAAGE